MQNLERLHNCDTDYLVELIRQYIHNRIDRRMLVLRLLDGETFERIADIIYAEEGFRPDEKTVRTHIHKGETILFKHLPEIPC